MTGAEITKEAMQMIDTLVLINIKGNTIICMDLESDKERELTDTMFEFILANRYAEKQDYEKLFKPNFDLIVQQIKFLLHNGI